MLISTVVGDVLNNMDTGSNELSLFNCLRPCMINASVVKQIGLVEYELMHLCCTLRHAT